MDNNSRLMRLSTTFSMSVAIILITIKTIGWQVTESVAIFSSLVDSAQDLVISLINFIAIRYALKPADDDHSFGHGKAEDLAALAQGIFIIFIAGFIGIEALDRLHRPVEITSGSAGIAIMCISLFLTICLVVFQKYVVRKTKSTLIHADSMHYLSDILTNSAVIISLIFSTYLGLLWLDSALGFAIALYILWGGGVVAIKSFNNLMDKEHDNETRSEIEKIIKSHKEVIKLKNLRTRKSGTKTLIQFEFTMNGKATLKKSHDVAHKIEKSLLKKFPDADIFIHQEPEE